MVLRIILLLAEVSLGGATNTFKATIIIVSGLLLCSVGSYRNVLAEHLLTCAVACVKLVFDLKKLEVFASEMSANKRIIRSSLVQCASIFSCSQHLLNLQTCQHSYTKTIAMT